MQSIEQKERVGRERNAQIKRQIEELQAQLGNAAEEDETEAGPSSPKRRKVEGTVLAPNTPSPRKNHVLRPAKATASSSSRDSVVNFPIQKLEFVKPAPSDFLRKLGKSAVSTHNDVEIDPFVRSTAFTDAPATARDERLALVDNIPLGPIDHQAPFDDPHFLRIEPNSGIAFSSRIVSHDDLQDHLRARHFLAPSQLYSVARLTQDKQGYDVPVEADWVTIAVVAERGPYKLSRAPVAITSDEG
ncbi:unnamed protein product, partial [Mycena citricolor]